MFGLFSAKCPVNVYEKAWVETRMRWLVQTLGIERIRQVQVVTPTDEFFPEPYNEKEEDVRRIFQQVASFLKVDLKRIELGILPPEEVDNYGIRMPADALGEYEDLGKKKVIRIIGSAFESPLKVIAILAHELCHEILLGGNLLDQTVIDHEKITDLTCVALGFGIFNANATIEEVSGTNGSMSWWSVGRVGYLEGRMFGYALAVFAFLREESKPSWRRHLRADARHAFDNGLSYLKRTNDTLCHPDTIRNKVLERSILELVEHIRTRTPTWQMAAFWEIRERNIQHPDVLEAVASRLLDRDVVLGENAASTLSALALRSQDVTVFEGIFPALFEALHAPSTEVRCFAATTLGNLRIQPDQVIAELNHMLKDLGTKLHFSDADTSETRRPARLAAYVCLALGNYGPAASLAVPRVIDVLAISCVEMHPNDIQFAVKALFQIEPNPVPIVKKHFGVPDAGLRDLVLEEIKRYQSATIRPMRFLKGDKPTE